MVPSSAGVNVRTSVLKCQSFANTCFVIWSMIEEQLA